MKLCKYVNENIIGYASFFSLFVFFLPFSFVFTVYQMIIIFLDETYCVPYSKLFLT